MPEVYIFLLFFISEFIFPSFFSPANLPYILHKDTDAVDSILQAFIPWFTIDWSEWAWKLFLSDFDLIIYWYEIDQVQ